MASWVSVLILLFNPSTSSNCQSPSFCPKLPTSLLAGPVSFVPCTICYTVYAKSLPINPRGKKRSRRENHQKPALEMTPVSSKGHRGARQAGMCLMQPSGRGWLHLLLAVCPSICVPSFTVAGQNV